MWDLASVSTDHSSLSDSTQALKAWLPLGFVFFGLQDLFLLGRGWGAATASLTQVRVATLHHHNRVRGALDDLGPLQLANLSFLVGPLWGNIKFHFYFTTRIAFSSIFLFFYWREMVPAIVYLQKSLPLLRFHWNTWAVLCPYFISLQDHNFSFALKSVASAKIPLVCMNLCT